MARNPKAYAAHKLPRFRGLPETPPTLGLDLTTALRKPEPPRQEHDFYPTTQDACTRSLLVADGDRIARCSVIEERAAGEGHLVRILQPWAEARGLAVVASDLVERGKGFQVASYYDTASAPGAALITNPPYNEITARDGHGRWLRHALADPGWTYMALLLSWEWPAGRINGLGALLDEQPFSYCYLCRWKVDFTGEGKPKHRTAWFVWDRLDPRRLDGRGPEPGFRFLDPADDRQEGLL